MCLCLRCMCQDGQRDSFASPSPLLREVCVSASENFGFAAALVELPETDKELSEKAPSLESLLREAMPNLSVIEVEKHKAAEGGGASLWRVAVFKNNSAFSTESLEGVLAALIECGFSVEGSFLSKVFAGQRKKQTEPPASLFYAHRSKDAFARRPESSLRPPPRLP